MSMAAVLFPAAILGLLVVVAVFFMQRSSLDLSPRGLLRGYLYLASLAGIITLSIGLGSLASYGLASALGTEAIYGSVSPKPMIAPCRPGDTACQGPTQEQLDQQHRHELESRERRKNEDLLRGITFGAFGGLFWVAHRAARRTVIGDAERGTALRRAYLMLGAVLFGLVTILLLPQGVYQVLASVVLPTSEFAYRQPADSLGGGLAALPIWLLYLRELVRDFRSAPQGG